LVCHHQLQPIFHIFFEADITITGKSFLFRVPPSGRNFALKSSGVIKEWAFEYFMNCETRPLFEKHAFYPSLCFASCPTLRRMSCTANQKYEKKSFEKSNSSNGGVVS